MQQKINQQNNDADRERAIGDIENGKGANPFNRSSHIKKIGHGAHPDAVNEIADGAA